MAPAQQKNLYKKLHFMEHAAPYWMALSVGLTINWFNYLNTFQQFQEDKHKQLAGVPA
jgi:hypothetical protein